MSDSTKYVMVRRILFFTGTAATIEVDLPGGRLESFAVD